MWIVGDNQIVTWLRLIRPRPLVGGSTGALVSSVNSTALDSMEEKACILYRFVSYISIPHLIFAPPHHHFCVILPSFPPSLPDGRCNILPSSHHCRHSAQFTTDLSTWNPFPSWQFQGFCGWLWWNEGQDDQEGNEGHE